jgi:hypothetical protein
MKTSWFILLFVLSLSLATCLAMTACGGDDDDNDNNDDVVDDDSADDDDDADDDTSDDDTVDDDTTDDDTTGDDSADDTGDDTTDDDTDVEYTSLNCVLPNDPGGILPNLVGGGAISGAITVYVFNDVTCEPVEGVSVYLNDDPTPVLTDVTGLAALTATSGEQKVTVLKYDSLGGGDPDFWGWSYKADAAFMYFRLHPYQTGLTYADSTDGAFFADGSLLSYTNPARLLDLFTQPITIGLTIPGISRGNFLTALFAETDETGNYDFANLFTQADFALTLTSDTTDLYYLPANVYVPATDFSILTFGVSVPDHISYKVPVEIAATVSPIEGIVAQVDVSAAIPGQDELFALVTCILANTDNLRDCLEELVIPLINDAISFPYVGASPEWDGIGAPNLTLLQTAANSDFELSLANNNNGLDYFAMSFAEIPNRALLPLGIGVVRGGKVQLKLAEIPNADYMIVAGGTDMLAVDPATLNFSFTALYADDVHDLAGGANLDAVKDFLPLFDTAGTSYDGTTGTVTWALASESDAVDAYLIAIAPAACAPEFYAVVPGTETSFTFPADLFHAGPSENDLVFVLGFDLPEDVNINVFDPTRILAYNGSALNVWSNLNVYDFIGDIL